MTTTPADRTHATTERKRKWDLSADDAPRLETDGNSAATGEFDPLLQAARINARLAARGIVSPTVPSVANQSPSSLGPFGNIYPPLPSQPPPPLPAGPPPPPPPSSAHRPGKPLPSQADLFGTSSVANSVVSAGDRPLSQYAPSLPPPEHLPNYDLAVYTREGEYFCKQLDINDLRNRYLVTREVTQKEIEADCQCIIQTCGKYYPDRHLAAGKEPPLHLRVLAKQKPALDAAIQRLKELLERSLHNLAEQQSIKPLPVRHERKLVIGIDAPSNYPLRGKLVGSAGAFVKHIIQQASARVQIRGIGSHFKEPGTDREADEPLFFHITANNEQSVEKAEALCRDLIETVKKDYEQWRQMQQMQQQQQMFGAYYAGYVLPGTVLPPAPHLAQMPPGYPTVYPPPSQQQPPN